MTGFISLNPKLFTFISGAAITGLSGGIVALGNLGQHEREWLFREVPEAGDPSKYGQELDGKHFHEAPIVKSSYKKLIAGDVDYNGGNYLIYYGSQACPHCTKFIYGSEEIARGNIWLKRDLMSDGAWMKTYKYTKLDPELTVKPKFIMFEDVPHVPDHAVNDDHWGLPWLKWDKTELEHGRIAGEYKRNDESAKNFRKVMDYAIETFGHEKVGGTPTVIVYKNGVPKVFGKDELPGLNEKVENYASSVDLELKRYVKYYYLFTTKK